LNKNNNWKKNVESNAEVADLKGTLIKTIKGAVKGDDHEKKMED
jgi:hypothetical protein